MTANKLLVYLFRRDLRVADNAILHHLASTTDHGFTHLLPVFVFPHNQIELSGLLKNGEQNPFEPARSEVGKFWRCGPHRARFLAQAVWDLKQSLEAHNSGLIIRAGDPAQILDHLVQHLKEAGGISASAVWMTEDVAHEEVREQESIAETCAALGLDFKLCPDEKYFIDEYVDLLLANCAVVLLLTRILVAISASSPPTNFLMCSRPIENHKSPCEVNHDHHCPPSSLRYRLSHHLRRFRARKRHSRFRTHWRTWRGAC